MTEQHPFDQAIALAQLTDHEFAGHTSAAYWNAISPYGGTTVATLLQAVLQHPQRLGDPLALTVNFAGPVQRGPFVVSAIPVRTGRSTQHWQIALRQDDDPQPAATATAVFALRRPTWSDTEATRPAARGPATLERYHSPGGLPFLDRYDIRYVDGDPLAGRADSRTACWIADVPPRRIDFPSLAAYCDSFIPRIFVRSGTMRPIATVTLSINFHVDGATLDRQQGRHAFGQAHANAFNGGYYDQEGKLWTEDGTLLATTHQLVWFRDA